MGVLRAPEAGAGKCLDRHKFILLSARPSNPHIPGGSLAIPPSVVPGLRLGLDEPILLTLLGVSHGGSSPRKECADAAVCSCPGAQLLQQGSGCLVKQWEKFLQRQWLLLHRYSHLESSEGGIRTKELPLCVYSQSWPCLFNTCAVSCANSSQKAGAGGGYVLISRQGPTYVLVEMK